MIKIIYRWKLAVITRKYHKVVVERNAAYDVQEGIFHHKKFVQYQRAFEEAVLNPMLQPAQSPPAIELRTCNVGASTNGGDVAGRAVSNRTVQQLKDSLEQIRLSCARRAEEKKTPLLTRELQDKLLDIAIPLPEDRDVWQDVWTPAFEVQNDTVFVYRGNLAIKDSEDLAGVFARPTFREELPRSRVQRLSGYLHENVFGLLRLFSR